MWFWARSALVSQTLPRPSAMPLITGKTGPARTRLVEETTRAIPGPSPTPAAARVTGDDTGRRKAPTPPTNAATQARTTMARAGTRIRYLRRRCRPRSASPGATRSSTIEGTLSDLDPAGDRGHAGGQDEQHVPAGRRVIAVRGRGRCQPVRAVGLVSEIDIALVEVVGVGHRARLDQRDPPDAREVGGRDRELLVVAHRRRGAGDRRPCAREQVRRGEDLAGLLER